MTYLTSIVAVEAKEPMVITMQDNFFPDDKMRYEVEALTLALEKTKHKYGEYRIKLIPRMRVNRRAMSDIDKHSYQNYFVVYSATDQLVKRFLPVEFPVDLGVNNYRVAFVSKETKEKLKHIETIEKLTAFSLVQKIGWLDTKILKAANFNVFEASHFLGMFKMVSKNYIDILFRGVGKVVTDFKNSADCKNLFLDEHFLLYYPLPKFYFTHKKNKLAAKRIEEGLVIAFKDGSLQKIWQKHFGESIKLANLSNRKTFILENPFISTLKPTYKQYFLNFTDHNKQ